MGSCNNDPLSPGIEYMPDMYRSPAIEEYVDYGEMKDRINDSVAMTLSAKIPVTGTIPYSEDPAKAQFNYPYPYPNTPEGYEAAGAGLKNPIAFTEEVYLHAQAKYEIFCIHCHGEKGNGQGGLVQKGKFAAPPAYQTVPDLTQGKMFHTLMYGKGNMGSHAGQLSREDRWKLVHYVQSLRDEKYDWAAVQAAPTQVPATTVATDANQTEVNH
jgi:mono/diheme cytochrome c family protein